MAVTESPTQKSVTKTFRPTARLLQLLGDELIASPRLAVFELVKNAFDADASTVSIRLDLGQSKPKSITVTDDGSGMTMETLANIWMVPGNNHRKHQRATGDRTPRHNRLPIGEKGVGRFAAHKLGDRITLITKAASSDECVVDIDWRKLAGHEFLDEAPVIISTHRPELFTGQTTGTQIRITELRNEWTRGEVRRLYNQVTSICSPFESPEDFKATLEIPGSENWLSRLPGVQDILDKAMWKFSFTLEQGIFNWDYEFRRIPGLNIEGRRNLGNHRQVQLRRDRSSDHSQTPDTVTPGFQEGIGSIHGVFHVYDRDQAIRALVPEQKLVTDYLNENGGIRVYRDGIRVYNYGESGDDWLGLDLRRVNSPTFRISRNIIIGAVHLSLAESDQLQEKTNREGFIENDACRRLKSTVEGVLGTLEAERNIDKQRIRQATGTSSGPVVFGFDRLVDDLEKELNALKINNPRLTSRLQQIRNHHHEMQETLLSAGISGLNLAVIFHEIERGVHALRQALVNGATGEILTRQANNLVDLLSNYSLLLRKNQHRRYSALQLVKSAQEISRIRLEFHQVELISPLLENNEPEFHTRIAFNLVLGSLTNLIDNALHWLKIRWPEGLTSEGDPTRKLYIGVSRDLGPRPAIVVADNGPGFQGDLPEHLVRPFFTRKTAGMGLGLYYADVTMQLQEGQLAFPQPGEVELPEGLDGAVVAMIFKEDE